jgi:hypothetical protein
MQTQMPFPEEDLIMLKLLIRLRDVAEPRTQKIIEGRMKSLGFPARDLHLDYSTLSLPDLERLFGAGSIRVRGGADLPVPHGFSV